MSKLVVACVPVHRIAPDLHTIRGDFDACNTERLILEYADTYRTQTKADLVLLIDDKALWDKKGGVITVSEGMISPEFSNWISWEKYFSERELIANAIKGGLPSALEGVCLWTSGTGFTCGGIVHQLLSEIMEHFGGVEDITFFIPAMNCYLAIKTYLQRYWEDYDNSSLQQVTLHAVEEAKSRVYTK